ncbi:MAG: SRPBCC family protein [Sneathiella sp.]
MDRNTEISLLKRCANLLEQKTTELAPEEGACPVDHYISQDRFDSEMKTIFKQSPMIVAHGSDLPEAGSYHAFKWLEDFPLLLTRDREGIVHAFANVCKHRGSRLAPEGKGCARLLVCPYHAWSYDLDGRLKGVPHKKTGFPSLITDTIGLKELPVAEAFGFIWVQKEGQGPLNIRDHLAGLANDFAWFAGEEHVLFAQTDKVWNLNWKILVEGGLESYHFKIAHRDTIAPLFNDNLSVFDEFGPHFRSILTKTAMKRLKEIPQDDWYIRENANILYSLYPFTTILIQPDHFAVINAVPLGPDQTKISVQTFVPKDSLESEKARSHWQANFDFTNNTLIEDFELGEQIQSGMMAGANDVLRFGRFENALARFHDITEEKLSNTSIGAK